MGLVLLLLEMGVDVNGSGHNGGTALTTAPIFNRVEIIDVLCANRADIRAMLTGSRHSPAA